MKQKIYRILNEKIVSSNSNDCKIFTNDSEKIDDETIDSPRISITPNQPLTNYCETNEINEQNNQQQNSIENNYCFKEISNKNLLEKRNCFFFIL